MHRSLRLIPTIGAAAAMATAALLLGAAPLQDAPDPGPPGPAPSEHSPGADGAQGRGEPVPSDDEPREVILHLRDGQMVRGVLVEETPEGLVLAIAGIRTSFPAASVDRYRVLPSVMQRYREIREAIGDDAQQIIRLAEWLRDQGRYELAMAEVERALALEPANAEARRLRAFIAGQLELRERARRREDGGAPGAEERAVDDRADDRRAAAVDRVEFPLLTPEQINLIKVYEIDLSRPPRMVIQRDTITRLMQAFAGHALIPVTREGREAIYRQRPAQVLELMFRLRAREFYPEVRVLDHPESMKLFRDNVQRPWLVNSCATNLCHGGEDAGRLMLSNRRMHADPSFYTNFLILDQFRLAPDGTPLINYDQPERSPLLHMGLPRDSSLYPHPPVLKGAGGRDIWRPTFRSTDDRRFKQAADWIRSMYRPRPEYAIDYQPPGRPLAEPTEEEPGVR